MGGRFFVTVIAPTQRGLIALREYDLDLFQPTAEASREDEFTIEGLLSLEDVGRLVEGGYRVIVKEEASGKARAPLEIVAFEDWIKAMKE